MIRNERGLSLLEMLVAMTVFLIVLGAVMHALGTQTRGFRRGTDEMGMLQNLRYGVDQLDQDLRLAGANTANRQATVVYAGPNTLAFNADIVSNVTGDIAAVYVDPDAPAGEVSGWLQAAATTIPGSSPAFTYPLADYSNNAAETVIYYFTLDGSTTRADDYLLMRRVNARPAERLMRNVLAPTSSSFFRYSYLNAPSGGGNLRVDTVPTAWGALRHTAAQHGALPDTGVVARIDLLRSVEVRYRVTNGRSGADERIRATAALLAMPNAGVKKLQSCGDPPLFGQAVTALWSPLLTPPAVAVSWNASVDEASGEQDVIRYVLWRRVGGVGDWGDPYASIPSGTSPYSFADPDVASLSLYQYAVAAQDCTPSLSAKSLSNTVLVP